MALKKKIKQINLIPLINIIFLMLIFFMLAGTIAKIDPYKINVPESIIKNDPLTPFLTIIVKKNGEIFIDSKNKKKELSLIIFKTSTNKERKLGPVLAERLWIYLASS